MAGPGGLQFGRDQERKANEDQKEGEKLSPGEGTSEGGIRFPKDLGDAAEQRIADEENSGQNSITETEPGSQDPENEKEYGALQHGFVNLGGMAR